MRLEHLAGALAAVIVCLPAPAPAQELRESGTAAARDQGDSAIKVLELGVHYGAPERLSGSISGVFFYGGLDPKRGLPKENLAIRAVAGQGGVSVGIGHRAPFYGPFGPEALMTVTRTFSSPRGGIARSTYVGFEVGYQLMGHVSIGVARQVDGPSDRRDTILTWNVGVQIPYGFWRW